MRCIYNEAIPLHRLGRLAIRRASHVEPAKSGSWMADLTPVGGPVLGPFSQRSQALAAEQDWLVRHWLSPIG
jgi:hypothetical protein